MKILIHTCCAPCLIIPLKKIKQQGDEPTIFYFNPNIHPYTEYIKRLNTLENYQSDENFRMIRGEYDPNLFFQNVVFRESERCRICYWIRLSETARVARKGKFDAFTTTVLYSIFQKHNLAKEVGEECGKKYEVPFFYEDFRKGWREGVIKSKEIGMYRQPYCGCLYSEWERYS